jgi:hypothetical protein
MAVDTQPLRRRPDGDKVLLYLDQSALSDLACNPDFSPLKALLLEGVEADQLLCPWSPEHHAETYDSGRWAEIAKLGDELSMGIDFRFDEEINLAEIYAAAAEFSGEAPRPRWREAFHKDPHASRESLYSGGFRVNVSFPPGEIDQEDRDYTRSFEDERMTAIYAEVRELGYTFEQQAEREFEAMIYGKLGPLTDPDRFQREYLTKALALEKVASAGVVDISIGSAYGLAMTVSEKKMHAERLVQRYPKVADDLAGFVASPALRNMPSLRYPALLRAGLALTPNRKAKQGDGYDLSHLMKGLSRCDIVTADSGMVEMVTGFKLVSNECRIFRGRDVESLIAAVRGLLDGAGPMT